MTKKKQLAFFRTNCKVMQKERKYKMIHNKLDDHRDDRGFVVNPFNHIENTGDISNCHAFSIEPGCSRGNHTHPGRNEEVLLLAGKIDIITPDKAVTVSVKNPEIVSIPENTKHTFKNNSNTTATVICWSNKYDSDYIGDDTIW